MRIELFLDEGEEYPQLFSVWRVDQNTGRADLTTRRNYVDDREGWDQWRKTDDENIRLKAENAKLWEYLQDLAEHIREDDGFGLDYGWMLDRMRELGVVE